MANLKVVTDSGSDLSKELLGEYNIEMIPIPVQIGEEEYKDRENIFPEEFYNSLKDIEGIPKTSQIAPYTFQQRFADLLEEHEHIFYISFSSELSGIYNSVNTARNLLEADRITILNSRAASLGQGLIVLKAAELVKEGVSLEELISQIEKYRDQMYHIFRVGSLEMLKKGGRISSAKAFVGSLLNINPILEVTEEGEIVPLTKVRGEEKALDYLVKTIKEEALDLSKQRIGISHGNVPKLAEKLANRIREETEVKEIVTTMLGAAIGSHAGPGTLALYFRREL